MNLETIRHATRTKRVRAAIAAGLIAPAALTVALAGGSANAADGDADNSGTDAQTVTSTATYDGELPEGVPTEGSITVSGAIQAGDEGPTVTKIGEGTQTFTSSAAIDESALPEGAPTEGSFSSSASAVKAK